MLSCLGIYIDKNLIKYGKVKKTKDSYKIEAFNVEVFENLEEALNKIIAETNSYKTPICINISNELYNYFDVFSMLEKKDITKSLEIEFEMLCSKKGYDESALTSRYILRENKQDFDKYKAIYISTNKKEIEKNSKYLSDYKLVAMTPVSTSITNLLDPAENENIAIINIENETKITTIIDGEIYRIDVLNSGMEEVIEKINHIELSWKKAYEVCKNITIYGHEVRNMDENEYLDIVMPILYKIANESKKILGSFKEKIDKVYITGIGASINNIDLYFQDFFKKSKCEILKPFFIDTNSLKIPTKEYIEVNSAIALALDGLGQLNKDLNFTSNSRFDAFDLETIINSKNNFDFKSIFKDPLDLKEKMLIRVIAVFIITSICFGIFGGILSRNINKQKSEINQKLAQTTEQIENLDNQLEQIKNHTSTYNALINSVNSTVNVSPNSKNNRIISKDAIPNMLNKIMFIIPKYVQIISIENTSSNHIVIEAVSEKYEQLGYFVAAIKNDGMLKNIKSTPGTKSDSLVQITIEGDLP